MTAARPAADVRVDWGLLGLHRHEGWWDILVVVDVLSFSTVVEMALSQGALVFPCSHDADEARSLAASSGGVVAARRGECGFSLSPASVRTIPAGTRLVLPSPNGSAITRAAVGADSRRHVLVGCLRNAAAVAEAVCLPGAHVLVLPAAERRRDGTPRFAREDWLGCGAILERMAARGTPTSCSRAQAALAAARRTPDFVSALLDCRSGRELLKRGFAEDVRLAAEIDVSVTVPELGGHALAATAHGARGGA